MGLVDLLQVRRPAGEGWACRRRAQEGSAPPDVMGLAEERARGGGARGELAEAGTMAPGLSLTPPYSDQREGTAATAWLRRIAWLSLMNFLGASPRRALAAAVLAANG